MYRIIFTRNALRNLRNLDKRYKKAVSKAFLKLSVNPKIGSPLKRELKGYWKLRFSRYRIIYKIQNRRLIVIIFEIRHRKEVYR